MNAIREWLEDLDSDLGHLVSLLAQGKTWSVYQVKGICRRFTKTFCLDFTLDVALRPPTLCFLTGLPPWIPTRTNAQNIRATL
jgi:hypothetical protein